MTVKTLSWQSNEWDCVTAPQGEGGAASSLGTFKTKQYNQLANMLESTFFTLAPREGLDNVVGVFSISDLGV